MKVRTWMSAHPVSISPHATVWDAMQLLVQGSLHRLPVIQDDGVLVGIITERDIQNRLNLSLIHMQMDDMPPVLQVTVETFMSRNVVTVSPDTEITEAAARMVRHAVEGLPVLEDGRLVGIITSTDLFYALIELERRTRTQAEILEEEVRARTRHLEVLNSTIRAVSQSLRSEEVLRQLVAEARKLVRFDRARANLLEEDGETLRVLEVFSEQPHDVQEFKVARAGTASDWVIRTGESILIDDMENAQERFPSTPALMGPGARTLLVVPLQSRGQVFGTITFAARKMGAFDDRERSIASQIASQAGQALFNARQYEKNQELVQRLQEADRVRHEFLGIVSHDLRSPLQSILGYMQVFQTQKLGELTPAYLEMVRDTASLVGYMVRLVEDLSDVGLIGARGLKLHPERLELEVFVRDLVMGLEGQARSRGVELFGEIQPDTYVEADPVRLRQMLTNLVTNGVKFNRRGGKVRVGVKRVGEEIHFAVEDTGDGIPAEELNRLFELFHRSDRHRRTEGTGLGLFITRELARVHGGRVEVASTLGEGTTFTLILPISRAEPVVADRRSGRDRRATPRS